LNGHFESWWIKRFTSAPFCARRRRLNKKRHPQYSRAKKLHHAGNDRDAGAIFNRRRPIETVIYYSPPCRRE